MTDLGFLVIFVLDPRQDAEHFHLILMKTEKQELSFTPETPSEQILKYYPEAIDSNELTRRFLNFVDLVYELKAENIVLGQSVCSDDLNNIQFPPSAKGMLGPFNLGGLNGYPFTGLTGMGAFSHHYPECGALLIFYGPHIGIGNEGVPGRVIRPGQTKPSTCCGAAAAALKKLEAGGIRPQVPVEPDYQQGTIEQIFLKQESRITSAPRERRILVATEVMYQAIHHQVRYLMDNTEFTSRYVFCFGGILINPDAKETSFIEVHDGYTVDVKTHETKEVKEEILAAI